MAKKKHYLCGYEKAHIYITNVYTIHDGCTEYHVGAESPSSGKQR